ncbi:MAG: DUF1343 domain-containing protein [Leptospirales bacterium]|nr:DUF1343 domain-containing protein [Leptospirales bacterium]
MPSMAAIERFLQMEDSVFHSGKVGLLCNHTSFDFSSGQYLFQILSRRGSLRRLFLPEHGLFAELQDQIPLSDTGVYSGLGLNGEIVSLYGNSEESLVVEAAALRDLDAIVIDIQDIGVRYYTFSTTMRYLFESMVHHGINLPVYILDKPNPCGSPIEGTVLSPLFESFVGPVGLPHRHGLTVGQLGRFFHEDARANFPLHVVPFSPQESVLAFPIPPSPNMPGPWTHLVYSGQCLLEGTNLSEGRGTTRPFEIFGAPFMANLEGRNPPRVTGAVLRPLRFIPTFHKHSGQLCSGFQVHLSGDAYHSLGHTLQLLRWIREECPEFAWHKGPYEFRSDRPAIELLAGDPTLIAYLNGTETWQTAQETLREGENNWRNRLRSLQ